MKEEVDEVGFCIQININIFYNFLVGGVMHIQITNQIAEFFEMQYHKKGLIDCFKFLDVEIPSSSIFKNFPVFGECAWTCPKYPTYQICNFLGIVCPIVWIFLDAYRALRELCIYTTVLNEFVQVYAQSTPKKQICNILWMALDRTAGLSWFFYVPLLKVKMLNNIYFMTYF